MTIDGKRVCIVIEQDVRRDGPDGEGTGFNVFLEGHRKGVSAEEMTTAEFWGSRLFLIVQEALRQSGAVQHVTKKPAPDVAPPPVDRSQQTTLHGTPVDELREKQAAQPTGMHDDYIVLTAAERAKGFVRPVRRSYKHEKCGAVTTMGRELAETYARDPKFYNATYCCKCGAHFPVGADGEFVWVDGGSKVGT